MKALPPLHLDHFGRARRRSRAGFVVLAAGLCAAAALAVWQGALMRTLDDYERRAAQRAKPAAVRPAPVEARRVNEAAQRARAVALELRLPWGDVFDAVEAASGPDVALLSVEPDARRAALRISGEARHKQAMLDYVTRLSAQRPFVRALLESHDERAGHRSSVQFTLVAHWEAQP